MLEQPGRLETCYEIIRQMMVEKSEGREKKILITSVEFIYRINYIQIQIEYFVYTFNANTKTLYENM